MTTLLWSLRTDDGLARDFVEALRANMLNGLMAIEPGLADQREQVERMSTALLPGEAIADLDIAGLGAEMARHNTSTCSPFTQRKAANTTWSSSWDSTLGVCLGKTTVHNARVRVADYSTSG